MRPRRTAPNHLLDGDPTAAGEQFAPSLALEAFHWFPYAIVVFDEHGRAIGWNERAKALLGPIDLHANCCSLIACGEAGGPLGGGCFTALARARTAPLPEARVDLGSESDPKAVWLTVARIGDSERTILHARPGDPRDRRRRTVPHWIDAPTLRIYTLGRTRVMSREAALSGRWLAGRAGQILKVLVRHRDRVVQTDELLDAIWPGSDIAAREKVRYFIHVLRDRLEPDRSKRAISSFVVSREGGYALNRDNVWVDADKFEADLKRGRDALRAGDRRLGGRLLRDAISIYEGDFLADEPYASWAIQERHRLRDLAGEALRTLARLSIEERALDDAGDWASRLGELEPFDEDVQRLVIAVALARGRRSDALRHYSALSTRIRTEFEEEPGFEFGDVSGDEIFRA